MVEEERKLLDESIIGPKEILFKFRIDVESLNVVVAKYPTKVSKCYFYFTEEVDHPYESNASQARSIYTTSSTSHMSVRVSIKSHLPMFFRNLNSYPKAIGWA